MKPQKQLHDTDILLDVIHTGTSGPEIVPTIFQQDGILDGIRSRSDKKSLKS